VNGRRVYVYWGYDEKTCGTFCISGTDITLVCGDITTVAPDTIVNAANHTLLGGGGVDGAIHKAAGPELLEECETLGGCQTGEAKLTKGYRLPARYVIHTVGPIYGAEHGREPELLASCYRNSLELARRHNIHTIAFPSISTGVYGYPMREAARVVHTTIVDYLKSQHFFREITFVLHTPTDFDLYKEEFASG
jgi:O-acetyl-ADP-ribose deacetylase (regulator of RNase III)